MVSNVAAILSQTNLTAGLDSSSTVTAVINRLSLAADTLELGVQHNLTHPNTHADMKNFISIELRYITEPQWVQAIIMRLNAATRSATGSPAIDFHNPSCVAIEQARASGILAMFRELRDPPPDTGEDRSWAARTAAASDDPSPDKRKAAAAKAKKKKGSLDPHRDHYTKDFFKHFARSLKYTDAAGVEKVACPRHILHSVIAGYPKCPHSHSKMPTPLTHPSTTEAAPAVKIFNTLWASLPKASKPKKV